MSSELTETYYTLDNEGELLTYQGLDVKFADLYEQYADDKLRQETNRRSGAEETATSLSDLASVDEAAPQIRVINQDAGDTVFMTDTLSSATEKARTYLELESPAKQTVAESKLGDVVQQTKHPAVSHSSPTVQTQQAEAVLRLSQHL